MMPNCVTIINVEHRDPTRDRPATLQRFRSNNGLFGND
jgi:hypothetical protein